MNNPGWGPFLFDTSAESRFARTNETHASRWWREYIRRNPVHVSSVTVFERMRGYAMLWHATEQGRRTTIEAARLAYLAAARRVWSLDAPTAAIAGEITALIPDPPTPPKRSHRRLESRTERLVRWRLDAMVAATALVTGLTLIHNNARDFQAIRNSIENSETRLSRVGPLNLIQCDLIGF